MAILIGLVLAVRLAQGTPGGEKTGYPKRKGPNGAPVHVIVYSDFQCPACAGVREPVEILRNQFPDSILLEFRHFPLERPHRWALTAALLTECAAGQGKFWELHDQIYAQQANWANEADALPLLVGYAHGVGLEVRSLERCLADSKTLAHVRAERAAGEARQVRSTPTIFINSHRLVGAPELAAEGRKLVLQELGRLDAGEEAR